MVSPPSSESSLSASASSRGGGEGALFCCGRGRGFGFGREAAREGGDGAASGVEARGSGDDVRRDLRK